MVLSAAAHPAPILRGTARLLLPVTLAAQDMVKICPLALSQEAGRERQFPPVASAVIGTLVHGVIEDANRKGVATSADPALALAERCNAWDASPEGGQRWPQLVPLRRYLVDERRRDALATITAGLAHIGRSVAKSGFKSIGGGPPPRPDPARANRWPEYPIGDEGLGLSGCIDLLISDGNGRLLVIDYKTSFDQEAEDQQEKRAVYHRQVQIYLLMLSRLHPHASLAGRLIGSHGEDEVPWSEAIAVAIEDHLIRLRTVLSVIGSGATVPSETACKFCPIRHRCPTFRPWLDAARAAGYPTLLSGNIWGTIEHPPRIGGHQTSMTVRDANGSVHVLNGLVPRDGFQLMVQGTEVSVYGMKPERDSEGNIKPTRHWERLSTGRTLCASVLIFTGHPMIA
jgi:PD-(D/E)XK nuclease superfamily